MRARRPESGTCQRGGDGNDLAQRFVQSLLVQVSSSMLKPTKGDFTMKVDLVIEQLEERIAPGAVTHGNNGFGNGGDDGVPGNSASNDSPNADQKAADVVR